MNKENMLKQVENKYVGDTKMSEYLRYDETVTIIMGVYEEVKDLYDISEVIYRLANGDSIGRFFGTNNITTIEEGLTDFYNY